MKVKLVILVVCLLLSNIVFAQEYQIRADAKINLRSWYSATSSIVETVPVGTVLQVVGRFNRWLKISRNGNETWIGDWLNFTRLGGVATLPPNRRRLHPRNHRLLSTTTASLFELATTRTTGCAAMTITSVMRQPAVLPRGIGTIVSCRQRRALEE